MIDKLKLAKRIELFLTDKVLRCLSIPCRNVNEREIIKKIVLETPSFGQYKLKQIDEQLIMNKNKTKFLILDIENEKKSEIVWN